MRLRTLFPVGIVLFALTAAPSDADLINVTGATTLLAAPPPDVRVNVGLESNTQGFLFMEASGLVLSASDGAEITQPGAYGLPLTPGIVGPAVVDVCYFHFDPVGIIGSSITGSFTFDSDIGGLIVTEGGLASSNDINPLTIYSSAGMGLELAAGSGDLVVLSADRRTIFYALGANVAADGFRVGVMEAPEPSTILLLGAGVLECVRRRRRGRALRVAPPERVPD